MIEAPYPELSELLVLIGEAGRRMSEIEATEGAAGNISIYIGWPVDPRRTFPNAETIPLPESAPELAGKAFLIIRIGPPTPRDHRQPGGQPRLSGGERRRRDGSIAHRPRPAL